MNIDWTVTWTVLTGLGSALGGYLTGRSKRAGDAAVDAAASAAEVSLIDQLRAEVTRLSARVTAMEGREGRLIRQVFRLEGLMVAAGLQPPPFDLEGTNPGAPP